MGAIAFVVARPGRQRGEELGVFAAACSYEHPSVPDLLPSQSVAYAVTFSDVYKG